MNPRLTAKERNLIKGALRRVFSRSDMRKAAIEATIVPVTVIPELLLLARPRVKTWCKCPECLSFFAKSDMEVDHQIPIVPVDLSLEEMTEIELVERIWCSPENLRAMCDECHTVKTKAENAERAAHRKLKKASLFTNDAQCVKVKRRTARRPKV